ncbi:hypothetical protein CNR22_17690 [Sphingobacteriaceae bacterium]|nr:hypothetical protein CNR22_17690 [Sphingobacteriaceae bacterium]
MLTNSYRHKFKRALSDKEKRELIDHVKASILNKVKADVYLSWDDLHFTVPFWVNNWNLFAMVDKGEFRFDSDTTLIYKIYYLKTFIIGLMIALTLAIGTREIVVVLVMFTFLITINWLTRRLRHHFFFNEIVSYADSLLENTTTTSQNSITEN